MLKSSLPKILRYSNFLCEIGYGLGMMVEVLCGILGGGNYSNNIRRWAFAIDGEGKSKLFL